MNGDSRPVRTEAVRTRILLAVHNGVPKSVAAVAAGCSKSAFWLWQADDDDFRAALDEAYNQWVTKLTDRALEIAMSNSKDSAAMTQWLLERRVFQFFARKERISTHSLNGDPEEELVTSTAEEPIEQVAARVEAVTRLLREAGVLDQDGGHDPVPETDEVHPVSSASRPNGLSTP